MVSTRISVSSALSLVPMNSFQFYQPFRLPDNYCPVLDDGLAYTVYFYTFSLRCIGGVLDLFDTPPDTKMYRKKGPILTIFTNTNVWVAYGASETSF